MDKKKISKQLNIFTKRVQNKYKPEKIILFGSYAQGKATKYSDVDILVISQSFKDIDPFKRHLALHKLTQDLNPDINAIGYTLEETKKLSYLTTLRDALQTGIQIA
ncbi:MAG: nucleotidyltransferase domain-containing protein [bacterium]|nr:nucleotidyltransferase domain-containing protein [bacterium]